MSAAPLLIVEGATKIFGGLTALDRVSFSLGEGEILGLVGPNGSGKSTLLNVLSGVYRPDAGTVSHLGRSLVGRSPSAIAAAGLARTFQNLQIFQGLSVGENVMVGRAARLKAGVLASVFGSRFARREEEEARERAYTLLAFVGIERYLDSPPSVLSYGQRRLMEIARALSSEPSVLMLDEPCAGLSHGEADTLAASIRTLAPKGISVIVIEHNMRFVMNLVERIVVLNFGRKIAEGDPSSVRGNKDVIAAYLGSQAHAAD